MAVGTSKHPKRRRLLRHRPLPPDPRNGRRRHRPYQREIQPLEERVGLHLRRPAPRPEPPGRVLVQQQGNQVPRVRLTGAARRVGGEGEGLLQDVTQRGLVGGAGKGGPAVDHLVDEDPQGPPVHAVPVGPTGGHLGRHVLVGPHERARPGRHRLGHEQPVRRNRLDLPGTEQPVGDAGEGCEGAWGSARGGERVRGEFRGFDGWDCVGAEGEVEVREHNVTVGSD